MIPALRVLILLCTMFVSAWAVAEPAAESEAGAQPVTLAPSAEEVRKACVTHHATGQIARRAGRLLEARENWLMCLREACPEVVRSDCTDFYTEVDRLIPSLILEARSERGDEINVHVEMDGKTLTDQLNGKPIAVDPGKHDLSFQLPNYPEVRKTVLLAEGQKGRVLTVHFELPKPAAIPPAPEKPKPAVHTARPTPKLTYVLLGGALLAGGTGVYLTISGFNDRDALSSSCQPFCPPSEVQALRTKFLAADISLITGALLGGAAAYVYLTRPEKSEPMLQRSGTATRLSLRRSKSAAMLELWSEF